MLLGMGQSNSSLADTENESEKMSNQLNAEDEAEGDIEEENAETDNEEQSKETDNKVGDNNAAEEQDEDD
jgi:hypothetical protein